MLVCPNPMSKTTLGSYWRFLLAGLFNQGQTGAVVPSQRFLIDRMIEPIPPITTTANTVMIIGWPINGDT